jgi:hypothetical protein
MFAHGASPAYFLPRPTAPSDCRTVNSLVLGRYFPNEGGGHRMEKPWLTPIVYLSDSDDTHDVVLESDLDPVDQTPRERGDRSRVKPVHGSLDTSPMKYRRASEVSNVYDLDPD